MRFNDTKNHQLPQSGATLIACNTTTSAVAIRVFNVPDKPGDTDININTVDQDSARIYDYTIPANDTKYFPVNPAYPIIVYNGTANSINWSVE